LIGAAGATCRLPTGMQLDEEKLRKLVEERRERDRFTQDSPVMPDVWLGFADRDVKQLDVLLTPADGVDPAELADDVRSRLGEATDAWVAYSGTYAAAYLNLEQLVHAVLPLSAWWGSERDWLATVLGAIEAVRSAKELPVDAAEKELRAAGRELLEAGGKAVPPERPSLKRVTRNRPAHRAVARSRQTIKADAVNRLFDVDCSQLAWAVVDSGIDATHPAFRLRDKEGVLYQAPFEEEGNRTRVVATYDMTRLRLAHRAAEQQGANHPDPAVAEMVEQYGDELQKLRTHLLNRGPLDWGLLEPLLRVPHTTSKKEEERNYKPPSDDHGTHVAGILAADWPNARAGGADDDELLGICPNLRLYDLRVFAPDDDGGGYEFTVSAALQFIDYLNSFGRKIKIAGANVSLSIPYEMSAFGCGQTPVCQEANRLVAGGVVVVAAAGNRGREEYLLGEGPEKELVEGFRMISLTDPGNAEEAITVGATHATNPHAYGVSYFSSRGPSADGRRKPDLVAPGEKIQAPAVGEKAAVMDGTSQAAPHVSGAAALLLARHRELIGKPRRVKKLLMDSATDLEREPYFQGAGLVDALRAAQAN
jgi:serine protease AprX